jgi:light-regulated signal transduction histidine kinase (bacteriophytochrome)
MSSPDPRPNVAKSAEQSLQELVYAVSHDLGASARTIKGFADLLTRRYAESLDADGQNFLRLMSKGASDLPAQLDGLLEYSRIESRGQPFSPTDVAKVWQSVKAAAALPISAVAAIVEQDELPIVSADAKQFAQLLSELLANALKFRREERLRVRLTAERMASGQPDSPAMWRFRLSDNGRGIAQQHLARVFQMFQRCCSDVPGVGAGLAIAQRIVQRHGGSIWAESEIGVGTTICFTLPGMPGMR